MNNFVSRSTNFHAPIISARGRISVIYRFLIYLLATRNPNQPGPTNQPLPIPLVDPIVTAFINLRQEFNILHNFFNDGSQEFNSLKNISVYFN